MLCRHGRHQLCRSLSFHQRLIPRPLLRPVELAAAHHLEVHRFHCRCRGRPPRRLSRRLCPPDPPGAARHPRWAMAVRRLFRRACLSAVLNGLRLPTCLRHCRQSGRRKCLRVMSLVFRLTHLVRVRPPTTLCQPFPGRLCCPWLGVKCLLRLLAPCRRLPRPLMRPMTMRTPFRRSCSCWRMAPRGLICQKVFVSVQTLLVLWFHPLQT